jgi:hypothetical protein
MAIRVETHTNHNLDSIVKSIDLYYYPGRISLCIEASNILNHEPLVSAITAAGFPTHEGTVRGFFVPLNQSTYTEFVRFLNSVSDTWNLRDIIDEINSSINNAFELQSIGAHAWIIPGQRVESNNGASSTNGAEDNASAQVTAENIRPSPISRPVTRPFPYRHIGIMLSQEQRDRDVAGIAPSRQVRELLARTEDVDHSSLFDQMDNEQLRGFTLPPVQFTPLPVHYIERVGRVFGAVPFFTTPNAQNDLMAQAVTASLLASEGPPRPLPDIGTHARTLNERQHEEPVPDEFRCLITTYIMTDPVYDPNHPQYKFEKTAIEHWLRTKLENPYTRTPLTSSVLVSDVELKERIAQYVARFLAGNSPSPMG